MYVCLYEILLCFPMVTTTFFDGIALICTALYYIVLYYLYCTVLYCSILNYIVPNCNALHRPITQCNAYLEVMSRPE